MHEDEYGEFGSSRTICISGHLCQSLSYGKLMSLHNYPSSESIKLHKVSPPSSSPVAASPRVPLQSPAPHLACKYGSKKRRTGSTEATWDLQKSFRA